MVLDGQQLPPPIMHQNQEITLHSPCSFQRVTHRFCYFNFTNFSMSDLVSWQLRSLVFTSSNWPAWVKDRTWAPEIHFVNGRYIVYYTAGMLDGRLSCGAAIAETSNPFGSYKDIGDPLVESPSSLGGAIDPHYFKDPKTRKSYLLWKADQPWSLQTSLIYIRELHFSGISFKVLSNFYIIHLITDYRKAIKQLICVFFIRCISGRIKSIAEQQF